MSDHPPTPRLDEPVEEMTPLEAAVEAHRLNVLATVGHRFTTGLTAAQVLADYDEAIRAHERSLATHPRETPAPTPTRAAVEQALSRYEWSLDVPYHRNARQLRAALLALFDAPPRGEAVAAWSARWPDGGLAWIRPIESWDAMQEKNALAAGLTLTPLYAALPVPPAGTDETGIEGLERRVAQSAGDNQALSPAGVVERLGRGRSGFDPQRDVSDFHLPPAGTREAVDTLRSAATYMRSAGKQLSERSPIFAVSLLSCADEISAIQRRLSAALPVPREGEAGTLKLMDAINWLMGCGDDFEPFLGCKASDNVPPFWWRPEFSRRAGLTYDAAQGKYVASLTASEGTSDA